MSADVGGVDSTAVPLRPQPEATHRIRSGHAPLRHARARARWRLTPWWARVLIIWILSRIVTTAILLAFAAVETHNSWTGAHPDYFAFAAVWDGGWYHIIEAVGYPSRLPIGLDGHVQQNAWAFMPAYPALVRVGVFATGASFDVVATCISFVFSLASAFMFHRLMSLVLPANTVLFSVVLFCVAPLSPIMQVAYAESMHTFLLIAALFLLLKRRYWMLLPVIAVASLTRPSGLAFALALAGHIVLRIVHRRREPFHRADVVAASVACGFSLLAGFAWVLIAWAVTGAPSAYTQTELSWRAAYIGYQELLPFTGWIQGANWWFGWFGLPTSAPWGGVCLLLAVAAFAVAMFLPPVRRLGTDLRIWVGGYVVYLLAVFFPQSSTFRLLIPTFPLLGALAQPRSLAYRIPAVVISIALQVGWVYIAYWVSSDDWTPP